MWIAKNSITNQFIGVEYNSIYDCQDFIDKECKDLEELCRKLIIEQNKLNFKLVLSFGNYVRCWNIEQDRWCTGFDF